MSVYAEAIDLTGRLLEALLAAAAPGPGGRPAADLRLAVGDLAATREAHLRDGTVGEPLARCFDLARRAGATLASMGRVREAALSWPAVSDLAAAVGVAAVRFALVQEAQIIAAGTYRSREEVEALVARVTTAFGAAEIAAADAMDQETYRGLVTLRASVIRHLTTAARPLPRVIRYTLADRTPVLALANRLYGDGERVDELIAENRIVHPAFMPAAGRALSR